MRQIQVTNLYIYKVIQGDSRFRIWGLSNRNSRDTLPKSNVLQKWTLKLNFDFVQKILSFTRRINKEVGIFYQIETAKSYQYGTRNLEKVSRNFLVRLILRIQRFMNMCYFSTSSGRRIDFLQNVLQNSDLPCIYFVYTLSQNHRKSYQKVAHIHGLKAIL